MFVVLFALIAGTMLERKVLLEFFCSFSCLTCTYASANSSSQSKKQTHCPQVFDQTDCKSCDCWYLLILEEPQNSVIFL